MKQISLFSSMVFSFFIGCASQAKSLDELIEKENGAEFGECKLSPSPKVDGEKIVVVIPSRFDDPKYWVTHSILFVGLTKEGSIQGELELKVADKLSPKEVISVSCDKNQLNIKIPGKKQPKELMYTWDGNKLHKRTNVNEKSKK